MTTPEAPRGDQTETLFDCSFEMALRDFTLEWRCRTNSRSLGVYGPSGAGKTSLLECLAGWRTPSRGRIVVNGVTFFDSTERIDLPARARRVGYLPQDVLLFPHLSARGNIELAGTTAQTQHPLQGNGEPPGDPSETDRASAQSAWRQRFDELVDLLEIGSLLDRSVGQLSGGERQRVGLARALYGVPRLLLLDEPLAALDAPLKRRILADLMRLRERFPVPLVLVSHDPLLGLVLCQRIQQLHRGRVLAEVPAEAAVADQSASSPVDAASAASAGASTMPSLLSTDNLIRGVATETNADTVRLDCAGTSVVVPQTANASAAGASIQSGDRVTAVIGSREILVATAEPELLSAVNVVETELVDVLAAHSEEAAGDVRRESSPGVLVRCRARGGQNVFVAHVTAGTAKRLELSAGRIVWVVFKAHAVEVIAVLQAALGADR